MKKIEQKEQKKIQEEEENVVITEDNKNQHQATLKRLKRGDENELEINID